MFEGKFQVQAPGGLIFGRAIKWKVVLRYEFVYFAGGLNMEGLIFRILR